MAPLTRSRFIVSTTLGYGVFAALWILLTDRVIAMFADLAAVAWVSTVKGMVFVLLTTAALYFALQSVPETRLQAREPDARKTGPDARDTLRWPAWLAYAFALVATIAVFLLHSGIAEAVVDRPLLILFVLPVILSALWGGRGPGLLATTLAGLGAAWAKVPDHSLAVTDPIDRLELAMLVGCGVLISVMSEALHRSRRRAFQRLDALQNSEQRYRELFDVNPHSMWVYDLGTLAFLAVNDAAVARYGYTRDEFLGMTLREIRPPEDVPALLDTVSRSGETSQSSKLWRHRLKDGTDILVEISSHALLFAGRPARVVTAHDVTARVAAEQEIRQLSRAVESSPASVVITDRLGNIEYVNPAFTRVTGYRRDEVLGQNTRILKSGTMSPAGYRELWAIITSGGTWQGEFNNRRKNGDLYWEYASISPICDPLGAITHFVAVKEDITGRKQAELALQQSEEKFREFFMTSRDCVFITTPDGTLVDFNDAALNLFGIASREDLAGIRVPDLYAVPSERDDLMRLVFSQGYVEDYPVSLRRRSGTLVDVLITTSALKNPDGSVRVFVGAIRDISERTKADQDRQRLEAQLLQAQKMDAIGRLAGGVAHDFNNMLNVILGYSDMVLERLPASDPMRDDIGEIRQAARRSADLTGQLLAFARRQTVAPRVLDLNEVIGERVRMLRRLIGEDIAFTVVPGADLGRVSIDPSQLDQVLANLSVNSRDAIAGVGSIIVETTNIHLDAGYCAVHPGFEVGDFVQLVFSDTGCGMDRSTQSRIFEPFFTTKETGQGTGLGLATVYGIVKQNGGFINVYSEPGHGTSFKIYLPRHDGDATGSEPSTDDWMETGTETILIVEDEAQILRMCQRVLEEAGYTVLAAASPFSAIVLAQQHPGPIHLLLSDVVMPDMNGKQLQARIEAVAPGIRTIFMSGYTADVVAHRGVLDAGIRFLQKPFSPRDLARRVREALDHT